MSRTLSFALVGLCLLGAAVPAPSLAQQAQAPVQVTTTKIGSNFYAIDGQGGRMGALVGPDGVFIVDSQSARITDQLVAAIRQHSNMPLKTMVIEPPRLLRRLG